VADGNIGAQPAVLTGMLMGAPLAPAAAPTAPAPAPAAAAPTPVAQARFCTQCGTALSPGARFCAGCGTAVGS